MTAFPTCTGCSIVRASCPTLAGLKAAIAGMNVTTMRHRCKARQPMFLPGAPVWVETYSNDIKEWEPERGETPIYRDWPAVFIRQEGSKAIAFIQPGALADDDATAFVPKANGRGFVKVTLSRVRAREGAIVEDISECKRCGVIPTIELACKRDDPSNYPKCEYYKPVTFLGGAIQLHNGQWHPVADDSDDVPF